MSSRRSSRTSTSPTSGVRELLADPSGDPSGIEIVQCAVTGIERTHYLSRARDVKLGQVRVDGQQ